MVLYSYSRTCLNDPRCYDQNLAYGQAIVFSYFVATCSSPNKTTAETTYCLITSFGLAWDSEWKIAFLGLE